MASLVIRRCPTARNEFQNLALHSIVLNQHPSTSNMVIGGVLLGPELFITFLLVSQEKKNVLAF